MERDIHEYDDIINLDRPASRHSSMPVEKRAAQFAPFAALKGYEDIVSETARLTEEKVCLADDEVERISSELSKISEIARDTGQFPCVRVTFFVRDSRKNGGKYDKLVACPKNVDALGGAIFFEGKVRVDFADIAEISIVPESYRIRKD